MKTVLALCAALVFPAAAIAQVPGHGPARLEPNPAQYAMSCAPGDSYLVTVTSASDCKTVTADNDHSTANVLFRFGSQHKVSSVVGSTADVLFCLHYTLTTTVTSACAGGGPTCLGMATGAPPGSTQAQCISIDDPGYEYVKISPLKWLGSSSTLGRCTAASNKGAVGGACLVDADCGASGTCNLGLRPSGVYASICNRGTTGQTVIINGCDQ